jgi:hypothetical protein
VDEEFGVLRCGNWLKDVLECPRDYTTLGRHLGVPLHWKGLARPSLAIGKHCAIVAFDYTLQKNADILIW